MHKIQALTYDYSSLDELLTDGIEHGKMIESIEQSLYSMVYHYSAENLEKKKLLRHYERLLALKGELLNLVRCR